MPGGSRRGEEGGVEDGRIGETPVPPGRGLTGRRPRLARSCCWDPWSFDDASGRWVQLEAQARSDVAGTDSLKLLTYNVWFADHCFEERRAALDRILAGSTADVIALQEVRPDLLEFLLERDWVRRYFLSTADPGWIGHDGVVMLLRHAPCRFVEHRLDAYPPRPLLVAELQLGDHLARLATIHLASMRQNAEAHAGQLEEAFPLLVGADPVVLVGDFNFCSSSTENRNLDPRYIDSWPLLRPGEPGYTEDTEANRMRREVSGKDKQVRFDRVLVRSDSGTWRPTDIQLVVTEPVAPERPSVFPSDHFGPSAALARRPSS